MLTAVVAVCLAGSTARLWAASPPSFTDVDSVAGGDVLLKWTNAARLEASTDLIGWTGLTTVSSGLTHQYLDTAAPHVGARFYRLSALPDTHVIAGDHLATDDGEATIHPIDHASLVLGWKNLMIYNDPVGGGGPYAHLPRADLILVSHTHTDHLHAATLTATLRDTGMIIAPAAVYSSLSATLRAKTISLANGQSTNLLGLTVEAVPAYNSNHPKGVGNGYVLTLGGRRIYFSGDTGDAPEIRALTGIDVAFVCMNVPWTMTVNQAAAVVRAFQPGIVYPYHYRNQDGSRANLTTFRTLVGRDLGIEVRNREWY